MTKQYKVTGMSCAACQVRVEKAVSKVEGVTSCAVSLLTNSMNVEGTASEAAIITAVKDAGYGIESKQSKKETGSNEDEDLLKDTETPLLKKRLIFSVIFLAVLMYFSMGHTMFHWSVPSFFHNNPVAHGLLQLLLSVIIMVINQKFFVNGFTSIYHRSPNMDALVSLGAGAAFGYSTFSLFMMTNLQAAGDTMGATMLMHDLYFESAATILTLITVGKMLEARSKGKTTDALKGLLKLAPQSANIIKDGNEITVSINEVRKGDIFVVRPGESVPVDGVTLEGHSAIDESSLTGESIPVEKTEGSLVSSGTINQSGFLRCEATRVGEDTTLQKIIQMVSDAAATKAPIAKIADKVSGVFVPVVMGIALVTLLAWLIVGESFGFAIARSISVLVISCPCALGLATPVAIMVGSGVGAKNGILFKTAISLENTGKAKVVALDKTGTITNGKPEVTDIIPAKSVSKEELLKIAYSLEKRSEHPLALAVTKMAESKGVTGYEVTDFTAVPGNGLMGSINETVYFGGNLNFIKERGSCISDEVVKEGERLSMDGKTPLYFTTKEKFLGLIAVADTIKEDSKEAIMELKNMGIHVVMLTGDNARTAAAIGKMAAVDEVIAGVLPQDKESTVRRLQQKGTVIMVGDGINDAPALTGADVGMAIGAGTDVAIDAADVVLMKNSLSDVAAAIKLSKYTLRNIHENLFWAFIYNVIGIPLAAGLLIPVFHLKLNPMFGAAAMSLSSFCVVTNALRLNFVKIYKKVQTNKKETKTMVKTLTIEGMMCGHCEMHVKKALEAINGVTEAKVSHENKNAVVTLSEDVADDVLKDAVSNEGYKVVDIK